MNIIDQITTILTTWDSTYKVSVGFNKAIEDFLASTVSDGKALYINYEGNNVGQQTESSGMLTITESIVIYLETNAGLDKANSLINLFANTRGYLDTAFGYRTIYFDSMNAISSETNKQFFAINLRSY